MLGIFSWDYKLCKLCSDPYDKTTKGHTIHPENCWTFPIFLVIQRSVCILLGDEKYQTRLEVFSYDHRV